jgi:hypothetical protein
MALLTRDMHDRQDAVYAVDELRQTCRGLAVCYHVPSSQADRTGPAKKRCSSAYVSSGASSGR